MAEDFMSEDFVKSFSKDNNRLLLRMCKIDFFAWSQKFVCMLQWKHQWLDRFGSAKIKEENAS